MLPPSFIEYALRGGAAGVFVTGCRDGGCAYRLGNRWTGQRLSGAREPHFRGGAEHKRLCVAWADRGEETQLGVTLARFRQGLAPSPGRNRIARPQRMTTHD